MSLMTYNEVRPWARAIKAKIVAHQMPPWYADGEPGKWSNDRRLTQAQIDKVVAWVNAGAPQGTDAVPAPPQFAHGWNHPSGRPPDLIVEAPEMKVPAEGESPWQFVYVKVPFKGDVWVEAAQVVPGNRAVVHHVLVMPAALPPNAEVDAEGRMKLGVSPNQGQSVDPVARAATPRPQPAGDALPGGAAGDFSAGWEPGLDTAVTYGPGVAARLSGNYLLFNLHYQPNGHATTDRTRVGLWLQKGPVSYTGGGTGLGLGSETFIVNGKELTGRYTAQVTLDVPPPGTKTVPDIAAGDADYRLTALLPIRQDMVLYSIQPHMHLRGKSMKYTAVYPDGREEELLNVPHYDFNWQIVYELRKACEAACGNHDSRRCQVGQLGQQQVQPASGPGCLLGRAELGRDVQPDPARRGAAEGTHNADRACARGGSDCAGASGSSAALAFLYLGGTSNEMLPKASRGICF